jgi:hypothetical protein
MFRERTCVSLRERRSVVDRPRTGQLARIVVAVAMALGIGLIGGPVPPASAVDGPTTPPAGSPQAIESWALAPTGADTAQPGTRTAFTYAVAPGAAVNDSATLWNFSTGPLTFTVYATDAFNNATGGFTLLPGNKEPKQLGSWISLDTRVITVPARTKVDIPFTLNVPAKAEPGDYAASVLASATTAAIQSDGHQVTLDRRTGSRVYLRVAGPVNPGLSVENVSSTYHGAFSPFDGSLDVSYTLRNPGNVRLGAKQEIVVHDIFGRTVAKTRVPTIDELLPGNAVTFHRSLTGVPATFRVSATVTATPTAPNGVTDALPAAATATTHTWAIPWTLVLLVILLVLLWRIWRRWHDPERRDPTTAGGPGPPGDGPGGGPPSSPSVPREPRISEPAGRFDGTPPL